MLRLFNSSSFSFVGITAVFALSKSLQTNDGSKFLVLPTRSSTAFSSRISVAYEQCKMDRLSPNENWLTRSLSEAFCSP